MRVKDIFARAAGGIAGAAVAVVLPHVGCLGMVMFGLMGTGLANPDNATMMTYVAGGGLLAGASAFGMAALKPSREACCIVFGETPRVRLKKAAGVAVLGFALAAGANSFLGRGLSDPAVTADAIYVAQLQGQSPWEVMKNICTGTTPGLTP